MMLYMKQKWIGYVLAAATLLFSPVLALAQDAEDKVYDARLENYGGTVTLENSSTALMWLLLILLAACCVAVMFKNARRTHLD